MEALTGLIFGVPLGVGLYYIVAAGLYYPVMLCLLFAGAAVGSVSQPLGRLFQNSQNPGSAFDLNYGPVIDVVLAVVAVFCCWFFTRSVLRQGYRVFAWVQLPLMSATTLALFFWTFAHHKPLFPFYGQ